jgi:hypothetical protein
MTTLSPKDMDRVLSNTFALEFLKAKLTQKDTSEPVTYSGPGSVTQDADGHLQLKLYHLYQASSDMVAEVNSALGAGSLEPGKIIEDHHYFDFEGFDVYGKRWTSPHIWISGDVSFPSNGRVVTGQLKRIECETPIAGEPTPPGAGIVQFAQFYIPGTFSIPFNLAEKTDNRIGMSACKIELENANCTIRKHETHLEVVVESATAISDEWLIRLLEGISVAIGSRLRPQLRNAKLGASRQVAIYSVVARSDASRLPPPIPTNYPHQAAELARFVALFVSKVATNHSQLVGYWYRVLRAFPNDLENSALVLTTSIEGLIKVHFLSLGNPDEEFLKQLAEAEPLLKEIKIGERARSRILSTIGNAKSPSPKSALFTLEKSGTLPKELISLWTKLRNKSAHADELKMENHELQEFINELHGCLELFYRLVMHHIQYSGKIIHYAKPGWPEGDLSEA